jgi:four helix bundle protein
MKKKAPLFVLAKAKDLASYIIAVTEKSPKKFRFTLVNRLQNYALDAIECIIKGNQAKETEERARHMSEAKTSLQMLDAFSLISYENGCILFAQYENIAKLLAETSMYLRKWRESVDKMVLSGQPV